MTNITLTPAYGRDYSSRAGAQRDLDAGKDFILNDISSPWDGKPCSLRDLQAAHPGQTIRVRYAGLQRVFPVTL